MDLPDENKSELEDFTIDATISFTNVKNFNVNMAPRKSRLQFNAADRRFTVHYNEGRQMITLEASELEPLRSRKCANGNVYVVNFKPKKDFSYTEMGIRSLALSVKQKLHNCLLVLVGVFTTTVRPPPAGGSKTPISLALAHLESDVYSEMMTNKDKEDNNSSEEPKKGTLQIKLAELPVQTAELEIAGLKWKLRWDKGENHCEITCNQGCVDRLWLCRAKCTFTVKDRTWVEWPDPSSNYWFNSKNLQTFGLHYSGGRHLKATAVKVHIEILWAAHETCFPPLDDILDLKYGKQSHAFHVNRHALAMHSPTYFGNFFFGDWAEKRKKHGEGYSIEEKADLDLDAFANMLYYVHLWAPLVEKQGFLERDEPYYLLNILGLAIKYTFPMLVHYVEKQLIKRGAGTMEQLVVAEYQNLPALKEHCLETIDVLEYSKNFMENTELLTRLGKETRQLLDKRFKQTAERYSRKRKLLEEEDSDEEEEEDDNDENSEEGEEDASSDESMDVVEDSEDE